MILQVSTRLVFIKTFRSFSHTAISLHWKFPTRDTSDVIILNSDDDDKLKSTISRWFFIFPSKPCNFQDDVVEEWRNWLSQLMQILTLECMCMWLYIHGISISIPTPLRLRMQKTLFSLALSANINFKCIHCQLVHHVCMVAIAVDVMVENKKEFDVIPNANLANLGL